MNINIFCISIRLTNGILTNNQHEPHHKRRSSVVFVKGVYILLQKWTSSSRKNKPYDNSHSVCFTPKIEDEIMVTTSIRFYLRNRSICYKCKPTRDAVCKILDGVILNFYSRNLWCKDSMYVRTSYSTEIRTDLVSGIWGLVMGS